MKIWLLCESSGERFLGRQGFDSYFPTTKWGAAFYMTPFRILKHQQGRWGFSCNKLIFQTWKKTCHHGFKPFVSSSPSCFLMGVPTHLVTFQSKTISSGRQLEVPIDNLQTAEGTIGSCDVCWENPESGSSDLLGEVRHARPQQFYSDRSDLSNPGKGNSPLHGGDFSDLRIWNPKMAETFITECNKGNKGFFSRTILVFKDELLCLVKKGKSESWRTFLWKWNLRQNVSATVIPLN